MIRHAILREVVGADALAAVTRPDLTPPLTGDCRVLPRLLSFIEFRAEDLHSAILILVLAALILTLDDGSGGNVGNADRALGLVDVLTAGTGGTVGIDLEVVGVELKVDLLDFGQDGNRRGRGVYPAAGLRDRYALDAMPAGFKLEP